MQGVSLSKYFRDEQLFSSLVAQRVGISQNPWLHFVSIMLPQQSEGLVHFFVKARSPSGSAGFVTSSISRTSISRAGTDDRSIKFRPRENVNPPANALGSGRENLCSNGARHALVMVGGVQFFIRWS